MVDTTLKTNTQGNYTFYNFSDNEYLIKTNNSNNEVVNYRIFNFFNGISRTLQFSDLQDTFFIKK
jgi:hypothetical protein